MSLLVPLFSRSRSAAHDLLTIVSAVIEMRFETGQENLKDLELGMFVGSGRFLVEEGKPVIVEYKLSKVVKG